MSRDGCVSDVDVNAIIEIAHWLGEHVFGIVGIAESRMLVELREGRMLEPAGVRIKNYDRKLGELKAELCQALSRCDAAAAEARDADAELQRAQAHLDELARMNPVFRRGEHERDLEDAKERKKLALRSCLAATKHEASAREVLNEIQGQIENVERVKKNLKWHMLDYESGYHLLPESMIGMSQLWECLRRRIRLFDAEGPISAVYEPLALIGNPGVGKTRALQPIRGMLYSAGVLPTETLYSINVHAGNLDVERVIDQINEKSHGILHIDASGYLAVADSDSSQYRRNQDALESTVLIVRRLLDAFPRLLVVIECHPPVAEEVLAAFDGVGGVFVRPKDRIACDDLTSEDLVALLLDSAVPMGPGRNASLAMADGNAREELARGLDLAKRTQGDRFAYGKILDRLGSDLVVNAIELESGKTQQGQFIVTSEVVRSALVNGGWVPAADDKEDRECVRAAAMAELDALIGLKNVKEAFAKIERTLEFKREIAVKRGVNGREVGPKPSFAFLGPAGTGKTTVARLMARLLYGIGVCDTDKLVVVNSNDLVAGYKGQSGPQTKRVIESARGGVLFIDEAYNLQASEGSGGGDFVDAVIQELLTAMTSGDLNVAFVFAGYEDSMKNFFNSNEGIRSRITNYVYFDAYRPEELAEIAVSKLEKAGFRFTLSSLSPLVQFMAYISTLGEEYANARGAEKAARELEDAKALLWERDPEGTDVCEIDEGVIRQVMREHGIEAPVVCDASVEPVRTVARDHGHDGVGGSEPRFSDVGKPATVHEAETLHQRPQASRDGDYKTLSGWIKAFEEAGPSQTTGVDARKGPMAINEVLEARGYITPKPSRRFTEKALADLDVREDERAGKTGTYIALLYSREAFVTALRMWHRSKASRRS